MFIKLDSEPIFNCLTNYGEAYVLQKTPRVTTGNVIALKNQKRIGRVKVSLIRRFKCRQKNEILLPFLSRSEFKTLEEWVEDIEKKDTTTYSPEYFLYHVTIISNPKLNIKERCEVKV